MVTESRKRAGFGEAEACKSVMKGEVCIHRVELRMVRSCLITGHPATPEGSAIRGDEVSPR